MVSTPVIHAITWITTYLPILEGQKAELALQCLHSEFRTSLSITLLTYLLKLKTVSDGADVTFCGQSAPPLRTLR